MRVSVGVRVLGCSGGGPLGAWWAAVMLAGPCPLSILHRCCCAADCCTNSANLPAFQVSLVVAHTEAAAELRYEVVEKLPALLRWELCVAYL